MASYNLYDGSVVYFTNGLTMLAHILKKAEEHCKANNIPEKDIIEASLAPDMKPLAFQIQTASNTSKNAIVRLINGTAHPMDDNEATFEELQQRIAKTQDILKSVKKEDFDLDVEAEIKVPMGPREVDFTKRGYVQTFAVPNFYFHAVTAYAILRSKGVTLGKLDFLRPGQ